MVANWRVKGERVMQKSWDYTTFHPQKLPPRTDLQSWDSLRNVNTMTQIAGDAGCNHLKKKKHVSNTLPSDQSWQKIDCPPLQLPIWSDFFQESQVLCGFPVSPFLAEAGTWAQALQLAQISTADTCSWTVKFYVHMAVWSPTHKISKQQFWMTWCFIYQKYPTVY